MIVTAEQLKAEELRRRYGRLLQDVAVFPTEANWDYIIANRMEGIGDLLLDKYLAALTVDDVDRHELHQISIDRFPDYLQAMPRDYAVEIVYPIASDFPDVFRDLVRRAGLFDADSIAILVDSGQASLAADVIDVYQPSYTPHDSERMAALSVKLDRLPDIGSYRTQRGIFGVSERYICPAGHSNDRSEQFCTHSGCGLNIKGLTETQSRAVDLFKERCRALAALFA